MRETCQRFLESQIQEPQRIKRKNAGEIGFNGWKILHILKERKVVILTEVALTLENGDARGCLQTLVHTSTDRSATVIFT